MLETVVDESAPGVWAVMPPVYFPRNGKKILFTMMETATLPKSFANKCNQAQEIWLPSNSNMEMFQKSQEDGDLDKNIELVHMPLGANTDLYKPFKPTDEQKSLFNIKTKGFVFLSLFGWSLRKGVDVLFKAYLQEFTKEDDVTLLIVSRKDGCASPEKNKEIRDQIKEYISRWSSLEDHPHIVHIGEAIPEEQLPILYNVANAYVSPSRGEGQGLPYLEAGACFPAGTKIWDGEKLKKIEHFYLRKKVLNHIGEDDYVTEVMNRKYSGEMVRLDAGGYFDKIDCTANHPFYAIKDSCPGWVCAKDLSVKDKLLYPVYAPTSETFYSNDIEIDADMAYVIGLYTAEGNIRVNTNVTFTLHKKETEYASSIIDILTNKFGDITHVTYCHDDENYMRVVANNKKFARMCHDLADRGSYFKKVSYKIRNSNDDVRISYLKGYFDGDSNYGNRSLDVSSASKNLLLGVRDILLSLGIISSLSFRRKTRTNSHYALYIGGCDKRKLYGMLGIPFEQPKGKGGRGYLEFVDFNGVKYLCYELKGKETYNVNDIDVYNLSVEKMKSYTVEQFAVHNCEKPVLATRCGGQLDFLNDDNSELIDIEGYGPGSQEIKCISSYYETAPFAVLGEKATNQLKERMRYVINNYSEAKKKAKLLRENIVQNFTWDLLADKVEKQLFGK
jgi:glycosyltransferase involved in cell wall biosynthesis